MSLDCKDKEKPVMPKTGQTNIISIKYVRVSTIVLGE